LNKEEAKANGLLGTLFPGNRNRSGTDRNLSGLSGKKPIIGTHYDGPRFPVGWNDFHIKPPFKKQSFFAIF
jgi:hypothetical protein